MRKESNDIFYFATKEFEEGNYTEAMKIYDDIFKNDWKWIKECLLEGCAFGLNNDLNKTGRIIDHLRLIEEYLEILTRLHNLKVSETNPVFIKINAAKKSIESKIEDNKKVFTFYEENINKLRVYQFNERMHWVKKYPNWQVKNIAEQDPMSILECIIKLDHFSIDNLFFIIAKHNSILKLENRKIYRLFIRALEINLIKQLVIKKWYVPEEPPEESYNYTDADTLRDAFDGDAEAMWQRLYQ